MAEMVLTKNIKVMAKDCLPKSIKVMAEMVIIRSIEVTADDCLLKSIKVLADNLRRRGPPLYFWDTTVSQVKGLKVE